MASAIILVMRGKRAGVGSSGCVPASIIFLAVRLPVLNSSLCLAVIVPVENLAESLQVAADSGAKRILLPMASVRDIPTIPGELFAKFQTSFYADLRDAPFKALGVE